jgi:tRNA1Val (adenine37-N6)-methyltransferase
VESHFKGWAKPGPVPPGATQRIEVPPGESLDAISGHFRLFQLRNGHRFSTDDVVTAWYGTTWASSAARILDLGSGIGSVAMIAAWRLPGAHVVTIEAQEESVRLARKSADYNGLSERFDIRLGDFRDSAAIRPEERFDLVLGSPPYFPRGTGIEGDHPQKVACRFELRGDIRDYCAVAAAHLAAGGVFAVVFPNEQRARVDEAAAAASLALLRTRPIVFREGEPPLLRLFAMVRAGDVPSELHRGPWEEPPLTIRTATGAVHREYVTIKLAIGFPP